VRAAGNRRAGIVVDDLWIGRGGEWVPCLLSNCIVYGGGHGIEFRRAIVVNVVGCAVHQSGGHAYYLRDSSNSVVLSGCRSFQVGGDAVHVDGSHEFNATGNIFCWHRGDGIVLRDVAWATIAGNNVIDSGVRVPDGGLRRGIVIAGDTRGAQVTGNALFNWGDQCPMAEGIVEEPTAHDNAVVGNNINYTAGAALDCHGARSTVASNVAVAAAAHVSMGRPPYPDFTLTKLHAFIDAQR
ncbi:MAG TPA: right-handed parallel beta-helix repeat-containing protein, partial [Tepidisphaeraceae bacterium]|nr:right-handed parallel beta-helix repeat-containing protein [Tepidisphaeraceae bacterium]